jgi:uncharacterized protein YcbK (DUF882 family)
MREILRMGSGRIDNVTHGCQLSRRQLLRLGAFASIAGAVPEPLWAAVKKFQPPEKHLSFFNTHTGESLKTMFCCEGEYVPEALESIKHILRDHRANEEKVIDVRLLDLLYDLNGELATNKPFHVISGYRSPRTNATLRERGGAATGVAVHSLHMDGKAIDIRVPGVKLATLKETAAFMRRGGVGYYPASDFVHVDVGRVRYW